jgi:Ni2+-binding GTPase involved in maturation of urease and hydrogenase
VIGEPGSGKTALLREAYDRVADAAGVTIYQADRRSGGAGRRRCTRCAR